MSWQGTRAFDDMLAEAVDQQRRRVLKVGARVRLMGTLAFLLIISALWLGGRADWAPYPLPLGIYALVATALLTLHRQPVVQGVVTAQSLVDVGLVFWLQMTALPLSPAPAGIAGFSLGLFCLAVVLSSLTLLPSVVYMTTLLSALAQAVLMRAAGVSHGSVALAGVVLLLVAILSQYGSQRMRQLVLALTRAEVERQLEVRRFLEVERARSTIEQMLDEARSQNERLMALQRDKDQLTQFLVHDLRSPLSSLTMTFSLLENEFSAAETGTRLAVRTGLATAGRMERMITELLDVPRLEEGRLELRPQRIEAFTLFEEVRLASSSAAQFRRLTLEVEVPRGLKLQGDRPLLMRVVENLTTNALRHTPPGGRVLLEAGEDERGPFLAVRNDGPSIPMELRERLFEKYSQGERERGGRTGYGLGLYFCRLAVEAHGGHIGLEEAPGWSTSFVARLPLPAEQTRARSA